MVHHNKLLLQLTTTYIYIHASGNQQLCVEVCKRMPKRSIAKRSAAALVYKHAGLQGEHIINAHTHALMLSPTLATQMRSLHCTPPHCKAHWSCTLLSMALFTRFYTLELLKNISNYFNITTTLSQCIAHIGICITYIHKLVKAFNNIFPLHTEPASGQGLWAYRCH